MPPEPKRKKIAIAPQIDPVQQEVRSQTSGSEHFGFEIHPFDSRPTLVG